MKHRFDIITVSRLFGTGGREFAKELSRHLEMPLFDREILSRLATELKTSEEIVETYEKMRYGAPEFLLAPLQSRYSFVERDIIGSKKYIASMKKVILKLASVGRMILLGRGGQCILHDHPGCFHLRLVADHSYRLQRLSRLEDYAVYNQRKLETLIGKMDAYRAEFTKKHFGRHIGDPTLYHLVINFSLLPPDRAMDLLRDLVGP